jgi:predicted transcriptional regulator
VKFRADEDLNATLQELADANQSAKTRVVREMILFALSEGFLGSEVGSAQTQPTGA